MWWTFVFVLGAAFATTEGVVYSSVNRTTPLPVCLTSQGSVGHVCDDVFHTNRILSDGTRQSEIRTVHMCSCPSGRSCPTHSNYTLYQSRNHQIRLCSLPNPWRRCRNREVAVEMHINNPAFQYRTHFVVKCYCPRHLNPVRTGSGVQISATTWFRSDQDNGHDVQYYRCRRSRGRGSRRRSRTRGQRQRRRGRSNSANVERA